MKFNPKWIVGKTIASVEMNPKRDRIRHDTIHSPVIQFTDGSRIYFTTEESETCASDGSYYGTGIVYSKPKQETK